MQSFLSGGMDIAAIEKPYTGDGCDLGGDGWSWPGAGVMEWWIAGLLGTEEERGQQWGLGPGWTSLDCQRRH